MRHSKKNMSSTTENKVLVKQFYEEVVNTGDIERICEFIAPDYAEIHDNIRYDCGIEGAKDHILGVRQTYSDLHLTIERQIAEGEWIVTLITARGIHTGTWMGIKPTGKPVEFSCVNIDKVINGKIVEHGGAANMLGPLLNIGAIKVVGSEDGKA